MQLLLGLFFFSVLLTTGNSLSCEVCNSQSTDCTGPTEKCTKDNDVCMILSTEINAGAQKIQTTTKNCSPKEACKVFEDLQGKTTTSQSPSTPGIPIGAVIKRAVCSKAPASLALFFPAFLGLLLMKLLF